MYKPAISSRQPIAAALLCMLTVSAFAGSVPADWPDLKPGMTTVEGLAMGKSNSKISTCITQADKVAAVKAADEFAATRKECEKTVYSKRGSTAIAEQRCKPAGEPAYVEHTEAIAVSANQVKTKSYRLVNGKETLVMETTHTRTGDCTGKEAPQAGSLEAMIEKAKAEAAASKGKKH